jgi:hypothetical protein
MYTGFCILSMLWKQKEENINVHVYWVLYCQFSLETERRKHRCICTQKITRIQNPVYMYIYIIFYLFPEKSENTEPSIHVHICFLLSASSAYWEYRTLYTYTSIFSSFCLQRILRIQNTEHSILLVLCFLLSVSRDYWEYSTQYTCTSMFSFFCFQRILRIQNPVYMYIYVFFFMFLETETKKHRCTCILCSVFSVFSGNRKKKT